MRLELDNLAHLDFSTICRTISMVHIATLSCNLYFLEY
ncbi:methyl-CpG-binding domain-containing protein 13 [Iris pallida]|uniref:Methyl-CpG-binding domain-containing protein 13 n=1 Tax=Iris pallida TaxID=29817 RepID=A0AAX6FWX5_IRIPA|nr:methyl-CpG-binding domain-containing protein 13 [Iris pallida]